MCVDRRGYQITYPLRNHGFGGTIGLPVRLCISWSRNKRGKISSVSQLGRSPSEFHALVKKRRMLLVAYFGTEESVSPKER